MRASELEKRSVTIESIHKEIELSDKEGNFKTFIPHFRYVSNEVILHLMGEGFKVTVGDWDAMMQNCTIIEW